MKQRLIFILLILMVSCKTETAKWQTLDLGAFKLKAPDSWRVFKVQGIDSYVGGITNNKDSLWFDYGWYSHEIDDEESASHLYGQDTINGLVAIIQIPKVEGRGSIRLSIPHVNDKDKFDMSGNNIKGTDTILKIFRSIVFKESDTTVNSSLTMAKFKSYPFGSGRTLYYNYCSGCHALIKYTAAPPLKEELKHRDIGWVYKFLTDRKSIIVDSLYKTSVKESGELTCPEFSNLTKDDIRQIISYIEGR